MAFDGLSSRLQMAMRRVTGRGRVNENDIEEMLREVRLSLLEADVNYKVVKEFTNNVKEKAAGFTEKVKEKFEDMNVDTSSSSTHNNDIDLDENTFTYTVKFEDVDDKKE